MHGTKDYGNVAPKETTYQLTDMAELAVRLGALPSLDRLGDIIFFEDFSNGIYNWETSYSGLDAAVSLSTTYFKNGGFAAKLMGGSTDTNLALIYKYLPYPVLSNFGLECCITIGAEIDYMGIYFTVFSALHYYSGDIKIDPVGNKIDYLNSGGVYETLVTNLSFLTDDRIYNNFKLVIDLVNKKYKRLCWNSGVITMEGLDLREFDVALPDCIELGFYVYSQAGLNGVSYLDNVIVTQNEP